MKINELKNNESKSLEVLEDFSQNPHNQAVSEAAQNVIRAGVNVPPPPCYPAPPIPQEALNRREEERLNRYLARREETKSNGESDLLSVINDFEIDLDETSQSKSSTDVESSPKEQRLPPPLPPRPPEAEEGLVSNDTQLFSYRFKLFQARNQDGTAKFEEIKYLDRFPELTEAADKLFGFIDKDCRYMDLEMQNINNSKPKGLKAITTSKSKKREIILKKSQDFLFSKFSGIARFFETVSFKLAKNGEYVASDQLIPCLVGALIGSYRNSVDHLKKMVRICERTYDCIEDLQKNSDEPHLEKMKRASVEMNTAIQVILNRLIK